MTYIVILMILQTISFINYDVTLLVFECTISLSHAMRPGLKIHHFEVA